MPRLTKSTPKYRKHRASGQAIVTLDGRDFYLGPHGTKASQREYDRLVAEWLANGRRLPSAAEEPPQTTMAELMAAYRRFARSYYRKSGKPTSEVAGVERAMSFVKNLYLRLPVSEFGPLKLKAVRQLMIDEGWARKSVNQHVGRIVRMVKWGVAEEIVPADVHQALATVSGLRAGRTEAPDPTPVLPIDEATVDATLKRLPRVVADMVRFQRLTGCRPGEVCEVRPMDVDRNENVWCYRPPSHKTEHHGRARTIFIGPKAQAVLLPYLLRSDSAHCFSPAESEAKRRRENHAKRKTPLSCGNRPGTNRKPKRAKQAGDRYTTASYRRAIHRTVDTINRERREKGLKELVEKWAPNRLRHTTATEIRKRFGLEASQVVLGHAAADVTQVYAERDMEKAAEVMLEVG